MRGVAVRDDVIVHLNFYPGLVNRNLYDRFSFEHMESEGEKKNEEEKEYFGFDLYPDRRNTNKQTWLGTFFGAHSRKEMDKVICEKNVYEAVKKNPLVRVLIGALEKAGCPFDLGRNITCEVCDFKVTGGYDMEWNQIVICQNQFKASRYPEVTLVHELIHMYDYCMNKIDFKNLDHLACSEIRAANLAHCSFVSSCLLGQSSLFNIKETHQYCVKMKATQSIMVARNMDFDSAFRAVLRVFDKCYNDLEPVGRRVRRNSNDPFLAYKESVAYGFNKPIDPS